MALAEELESTGNWLFRHRSYLPLIMIGIFLLAMRDFEYPGASETLDHLWEVLCLAVSFLGLGIRVVTVGYAPQGTSGRNTQVQRADVLNTTGPYAVVRNPLYLGNFLMWLGVSMLVFQWWATLIYVLVFWLYYERIVFAEEAYLRVKFGREYLAWAAATPVFIPDLRKYRRADVPFSAKNALRREFQGFFALILVMFVLEVVGELFARDRIELDLGWILLLGVSFLFWATMLTLKKRTKLLDVEGR